MFPKQAFLTKRMSYEIFFNISRNLAFSCAAIYFLFKTYFFNEFNPKHHS